MLDTAVFDDVPGAGQAMLSANICWACIANTWQHHSWYVTLLGLTTEDKPMLCYHLLCLHLEVDTAGFHTIPVICWACMGEDTQSFGYFCLLCEAEFCILLAQYMATSLFVRDTAGLDGR